MKDGSNPVFGVMSTNADGCLSGFVSVRACGLVGMVVIVMFVAVFREHARLVSLAAVRDFLFGERSELGVVGQ